MQLDMSFNVSLDHSNFAKENGLSYLGVQKEKNHQVVNYLLETLFSVPDHATMDLVEMLAVVRIEVLLTVACFNIYIFNF